MRRLQGLKEFVPGEKLGARKKLGIARRDFRQVLVSVLNLSFNVLCKMHVLAGMPF